MKKQNNKKSQRITFNEIIGEAYLDYLADKFLHPEKKRKFCALDVPNRNPEQISGGMWHSLVCKYSNKFNYN